MKIAYTFGPPANPPPGAVKYLVAASLNLAFSSKVYDIACSPDELETDLGDEVSISYSFIDSNGNSSPFGPDLIFTVLDDSVPTSPAGAPEVIEVRTIFNGV